MFNLFRPKPPIGSFRFLHTDLHSHLLPGIDDGAEDIEQSLELIRRLLDMGFQHLITTPHVMADLYPNTPGVIRRKLAEVQEAVKAKGWPIRIDAAAEYLLDEGFEPLLEKDKLLALPGKRVLVEMSFISEPPKFDQYLFSMQTKGYRPLLAHPERYLFLRDEPQRYQDLKDRGCEFQLNLLSLTGYYGKPTRENAYRLLKEGLIDYLATDLHHSRHAEALEALLTDKKVAKALHGKQFLNEQLADIQC